MEKMELFQSRNGGGLEHFQYEDDVILPVVSMPDPEKRLNDLKNLPLKNSVLVATYPKSGTHWVANIVLRLKRQDKDDDVSKWGFFELSPVEYLQAKSSGGVFTTHLHPKRMPESCRSSNVKVVFIVRNPKDVAVSFYHHFRKMKMMLNKQDWDEFLVDFMDGKVPWGPMGKYLKEWEREINENKQLDTAVFYYEDFIRDCFSTVKKLADFTGAKKTDDDLREIIQECSIDNLREKAEKGPDKVLKDDDGKSVIYRKGGIGDWKNHFTVAQNEMFDKYIQENFADSMFKFTYQ